MTIYDVILYSIILVGMILGIAIGVFSAFSCAEAKIEKQERQYIAKKKKQPTTRSKASGKDKPTLVERLEKKRDEALVLKDNRRLMKKGKSTETYKKKLKDRVGDRDLNSLNDNDCIFSQEDVATTIEEHRKKSNKSYEYLKKEFLNK